MTKLASIIRKTKQCRLVACGATVVAIALICAFAGQGLAQYLNGPPECEGLPAVAFEETAGPRGESAGSGTGSQAVMLPDGVSQAWWDHAYKWIEMQEYNVSCSERGLQAPNRAQNLRTYFGDDSVELVPRTETEPSWSWTWRTAALGRTGAMVEAAPVVPESHGARVEYDRGGFVEWYENRKEGVEQGFVIESPPKGEGYLCVEGSTSDCLKPRLDEDRLGIDLVDGNGARVLRYGDLLVRDALGEKLDAWFEIDESHIRMVADDRGAVYPVSIDPLLSDPDWTAASGQTGAQFGVSVATAGDVNGDGYSDVIVGASDFDSTETNEGRAYVYHGSSSGLPGTPNWKVDGGQAGANFGRSVATAGDVNGDGYSDVIVGALNYDDDETNEGQAYVFHGSSSGLSETFDWSKGSGQENAYFGTAVSTAGDVNGDGYSDVIVGASYFDSTQTNEGRAYVFFGSDTGVVDTPAWTADGGQWNAYFGEAVGTAGDVNGDGYSDVIVGAFSYYHGESEEGRAYVYHGSSGGLSESADMIMESNMENAHYGIAVSTAGDVNGDGYSDVVVGAMGYHNPQTQEGAAYVYPGSSSGLDTTKVWIVESNVTGSFFGSSVATAGDVNGDGYADVIVGAPEYDGGSGKVGRAYLYFGSSSGMSDERVWTWESDQALSLFGRSVATAGDVNGDGFSDVIVGAPHYDFGGGQEGEACVFYGTGSDPSAEDVWTSESDDALSRFGNSVASAGDVNGDGYSDVIVGAPYYDVSAGAEGRAFVFCGSDTGLPWTADWTADTWQQNAHFGVSVATAGDVNGDGYSDVIVGASDFDSTETNEGRAYVYHGSSSGLPGTPNWKVDGGQAGANFGHSVATAGDVNGDGYSDVIVGALDYDDDETDEGQAYVFHGSSSGLSETFDWSEGSGQENAYFGVAVSTAGDVNGDGYSDVIVGASYFDSTQTNEGRAYVFCGGACGLSGLPAWKADGGQWNAYFGEAVATAGDVNGDGYSDVIVGAFSYYHGESEEGRAYVYHGSSGGLSESADMIMESNMVNAHYGRSVSTAGDVNGDGYSDVVVGAIGYHNPQTQEGAAYVYPGSSSGLDTTKVWIVESDVTGSFFGQSVAAAGDVNGDGYADVIVGAPEYDGGSGKVGRAYLYYGNGGLGQARLARQLRVNEDVPIVPLGRSDSENAFRIRTIARTAEGRGDVRLEWEVEEFGTTFDGGSIGEGSWTDTGSPGAGGSSVTLTQQMSGLSQNTAYHWRLRVATKSPFFPRTPWVSIQYNGPEEADLLTAKTYDYPVPSADSTVVSLSDTLVATCPALDGDTLTITLTLKDACGEPIEGAPASGIYALADGVSPGTVSTCRTDTAWAVAATDSYGRTTIAFYDFIGCGDAALDVYALGVHVGSDTVEVRSFDLNANCIVGDDSESFSFITCCDFDGEGGPGMDDWLVYIGHAGHYYVDEDRSKAVLNRSVECLRLCPKADTTGVHKASYFVVSAKMRDGHNRVVPNVPMDSVYIEIPVPEGSGGDADFRFLCGASNRRVYALQDGTANGIMTIPAYYGGGHSQYLSLTTRAVMKSDTAQVWSTTIDSLVSFDINGSGQVESGDLGIFSGDYLGDYNYRSDFDCDGDIDGDDFDFMNGHYKHQCAASMEAKVTSCADFDRNVVESIRAVVRNAALDQLISRATSSEIKMLLGCVRELPEPENLPGDRAASAKLLPSRTILMQNVPNPSGPGTLIKYEVAPPGGAVGIRIFDAAGRLVKTLVDEHMPPGFYGIKWDGRNNEGRLVASGVYFYQMSAPGFDSKKRMMLVR